MPVLPGLLVSAALVATAALAFVGLLLAAAPGASSVPWPYLTGVIRFTVFQAAISTSLSLFLGAAVALALARRTKFRGRGLLIAALNLASVLPAVVAVFGIVAVFGRSGWLGTAAGLLRIDTTGWLYGLPGILLAHTFFNAPLAARVFLGALAAVPGERWRLAAELGFGPGAIFRVIDVPVLRREAPGLAALIFLLCFTSFAVVLTLGGGPRAATLEVAIYEAVRFDVDFGRAGILALIQLSVCLALAVPVLVMARRPGEGGTGGVAHARPDALAPGLRLLDAAVLVVAVLLVAPPLLAVLLSGLAGLPSLVRTDLVEAAVTSGAIAGPAACLSVASAVAIALAARALGTRGRPRAAALVALPGSLILAVPPVAMSAGLFVILRRGMDPSSLSLPLIALVNALMALPFALRQVEPPLILSAERYGRLSESLALSGFQRLLIVDWPLLGRPLLAALAIAAALSLGDLGVAAFFGSGSVQTLPLLLFQRMGSYRMDEAASVALLLAVVVLGLFLLAQRWSGEPLARSR